MLPYSKTNRISVFKIDRGRAAPVRREEMDVKIRQVSCTHDWMGRRSSRPEISSNGEVEVCVGATRSGVVSLAATLLTFSAAFFFGAPAVGLVAAVYLGLGFLVPAVFLEAVILGCVGAYVIG
jgi:hypothetical protein